MYLFKVILNNKRIPGAVLAAAVLVTPAVASAASAHVSASVNIRSGPGANYARLATLPAGATVNAGSCSRGWCRIYNGSRVGFVSARYVRFGSYSGPAYDAPSTTTVVVDNGYDGWAPGFGLGLGMGWATGGYWGHDYWRHGYWGHDYWRHGGHNHWNPRWGVGPKWGGRGWGNRHNWGPGPVRPHFGSGGFNRPAFNRGFGGHRFGNLRPMHAGR
ncbi:SH3 domain-containing protein [Brucella daejeonensis]|nr:SH3 domain-containing protein [Brucella daejeonensis]